MDFNPRPPRGGRPGLLLPPSTAPPYFNPRPPRGGRRGYSFANPATVPFQPTPSSRRATAILWVWTWLIWISTHALLAEGDRGCCCHHQRHHRISTHALLAEGDGTFQMWIDVEGVISTHALLAEGDGVYYWCHTPELYISTHALLAEGDVPVPPPAYCPIRVISTHALLAEGDGLEDRTIPYDGIFQPTPYSRRETLINSGLFIS